MSEDQTTQTAIDATNAPAQQGATDTASARTTDTGDNLDSLLKEFETQQAPASETTQPARTEQQAGTATNTPQAQDPVAREYIFRLDMEKTIKNVRGDLDAEYFDDSFVESWIDGQARKDPRLATAWTNRHSQPKQFEKVVGQLGREFAKKYGKLPDKAATEDREAVTHAVRGASQRAPEGQAPNFSSMSHNEFAAAKAKMFG